MAEDQFHDPLDRAEDLGRRQEPTAAPRPAAKKTAAKKATGRKTAGKKKAAKKTTGRKAAGKKAAKKTTGRKAAGKKAAKKTAGRPRVPRMPDPAGVAHTWLASYPPGVPPTYEYPLVPLTRLLDDAAQDFPHTEAVEFLGYSLSYRELLDHVDRFATALRNLGVGKGDRVGVVLPNCPQHVVTVFAVLRLGAVVVEVDHLGTAAELGHQVNDAGCVVVVCLDPIYQRLVQLKGRLDTVRHIIATGVQDSLPLVKRAVFPLRGRRDGSYHRIPDAEGVLRYTELIHRTAPSVTQEAVDPRRDCAVVLYAHGGGKGVMLSHFNLVASAFQSRLWLPDVQAGRENLLCVAPFSEGHSLSPALFFGVLNAATLTLLPGFEPGQVLNAIEKREPTLFAADREVYRRLVSVPKLAKRDLGSLRICWSTGGPLPPPVTAQFEDLTGAKLRGAQGVTECSSLTHANPVYGRAKQDTAGLPVTDTVCALVGLDDPTRPADGDAPGELAVAGPQVMLGYWGRPEESAAVLRDGWLLTGDLAAVDADGYFTIVGRKTDLLD